MARHKPAAQLEATRDRSSGRYVHSDLDQVCTCGHPLGKHSATVVAGSRPCFNGDDGEACDCERFEVRRG